MTIIVYILHYYLKVNGHRNKNFGIVIEKKMKKNLCYFVKFLKAKIIKN